ncbi:MAG: zinc ribbon domain-containing protein [Candidatus Dormibacteria bacterium]
MLCPECGKSSRDDVEYCNACGKPLIPLQEYTGVKDGETVKCAECSRMNPASANFCSGCGYALPAFTASASSAPRRSSSARFQHPHSTPSPAVYPAPAGTAHEGYRGRGFLVAREDFDAIDPTTHKVVHVLAGRTNVASGHWLITLRPDAFMYAA